MPISSQSTRIFKSEDPVMETDLQLLAKVNIFEQEKFDEGAKDLQNEINNWSLLANVAKDQDKAYINAKLNKLVSGIQQLGGVNLADHNNVNTLKNQGYNMYGDDNVMNPVLTTRRMQALQQDIFDKTNGKNAKDYDSVNGEYLLNSYSSWLNDGQQGTNYNGPTSLPQGNFDQYNKKINDVLTKLVPDINEAPQGVADAWNYYQVGNKFIKKDRVWAAIEANTSGQDKAVISAHAWKSMSGLQDNQLVDLQRKSYDSSLADLQSTYNTLKTQKSLTSDYTQRGLFDSQIKQIEGAINGVNAQKSGLPQLQEGQGLPEEYRQNLRDNLFFGAYKEQTANARAYEQKKTELKSNQAAIEKAKYTQSAYQFGMNYNLRKDEFGLKQKEYDLKEQRNMIELYGIYSGNMSSLGSLGIYGPAMSAPLSIIPNMGKDDATIVNDNVITQSDANVIAKATQFYQYGYDYLMNKDSELYSRWMVRGDDGHWKPKDNKAKIITESALKSAVEMYGNIAGMSIAERNGLTLSDDDLNLYRASKDMNQSLIYKEQINQLTDAVFTKAGLASPSQQNVVIKLNDGTEKIITMQKLREMKERGDPRLEELKAAAKNIDIEALRNKEMQEKFFQKHPELKNVLREYIPLGGAANTPEEKDFRQIQEEVMKKYPTQGFWKENLSISDRNSLDVAMNQMEHYYKQGEVKDAWTALSKTFNVYGRTASLPSIKGKPNPQLQSFIGTMIRDKYPELKDAVQDADVDIRRIWATYDINSNTTNKVRYMAEARYQTGSGTSKEGKNDKGDKIVTIDLTDQVLRDHNSTQGGPIGSMYADDDAQVVYGMLLNNTGMTPLNAKDNYNSALQTRSSGLLAHKYQIVANRNSMSGIDGYRVNILIPKGRDEQGIAQFQTMPVLNFDNLNPASKTASADFPSNFKYVQDYMDTWLGDMDHAKEFYRRLGIPFTPEKAKETPTQQ